MNIPYLDSIFKRKGIYAALHIIILLLSLYLVLIISIDTFKNLMFYRQPEFRKEQTWICIVFLIDFFGELFLSDNKRHYLVTHFLFFIVAIPYESIIIHFGIHLDKQISYIISFIPLVRGGYAMAIVIGWFAHNRAAGLFLTYLATLISTVYFASLAFYLFEHPVNSLVKHYTDALWWASMDVTTVGSNITAVTPVGRVLSVLLAALGMMMFPIFTVYVSSIMRTHNRKTAEQAILSATTTQSTPSIDNKEVGSMMGNRETETHKAATPADSKS